VEAFAPVVPAGIQTAMARATQPSVHAAIRRVVGIWSQRSIFQPPVLDAIAAAVAAGERGTLPPTDAGSSPHSDSSRKSPGETEWDGDVDVDGDGDGDGDDGVGRLRPSDRESNPYLQLAMPPTPLARSASVVATDEVASELAAHQRRCIVAAAAASLVERVRPEIRDGTLPLPMAQEVKPDSDAELAGLESELAVAEGLLRQHMAALMLVRAGRGRLAHKCRAALEQQQAALVTAVVANETLDAAGPLALSLHAAAQAGKTVRRPITVLLPSPGVSGGSPTATSVEGAWRGADAGGEAGASAVMDEYDLAALMSDDGGTMGLASTREMADAAAVTVRTDAALGSSTAARAITISTPSPAATARLSSSLTHPSGGKLVTSVSAAADASAQATRPHGDAATGGAAGLDIGKKRSRVRAGGSAHAAAGGDGSAGASKRKRKGASRSGGHDGMEAGGEEEDGEDGGAHKPAAAPAPVDKYAEIAGSGRRWDPVRGMFVDDTTSAYDLVDDSWREH